MGKLTVHIRNLRALEQVDWAPEGVCAVVGPNGAGKTTLVRAIQVLGRSATDPLALSAEFGDAAGMRSWGKAPQTAVTLEVVRDRQHWMLEVSGGAGDTSVKATLVDESDVKGGTPTHTRNGSYAPEQVGWVAALRGFSDADLFSLRHLGSRIADTRLLSARGDNAFAMLRHWHARREHRERYNFVLRGLKAGFPGLCDDVDFEEAGAIVTLRLYRPGAPDRPVPIGREANGFLSMLVTLTEVASGEPGGIVAIDEPENGLHPAVIRTLASVVAEHARERDLAVVFTTHSPLLLNQIARDHIFVLRAGEGLTPLDQLEDPQWLSGFLAGDLYANGEFGAPGE